MNIEACCFGSVIDVEEGVRETIFEIAKNCPLALLEKMRKTRSISPNSIDQDGQPLLCCILNSDNSQNGCSHSGNQEHDQAIESLLGMGADVDRSNSKNGKTALHYAVQRGDLDRIGCLLAYGASTRLKDSEGRAPYDCSNTKVRSLMIEHEKRREGLVGDISLLPKELAGVVSQYL